MARKKYSITLSTVGAKLDGRATGCIALTPKEAKFLVKIFDPDNWSNVTAEPFSGNISIDPHTLTVYDKEKMLYYICISTLGAKEEGTTSGTINITPQEVELLEYALDTSNWQELQNTLGDTGICRITPL